MPPLTLNTTEHVSMSGTQPMDETQDFLFGAYPRRVGNPNQWWVFSPDQMEVFLRESGGRRNIYATICRFRPDGTPISRVVAYDFDSPLKEAAFPGMDSDVDRMLAMWEDPGKAEEVLEPVLEDVRALIEASHRDGIPVMGVYTGMGVHVYQLFREAVNPVDAMTSTANRYVEELDLTTADPRVIGDLQRILRVPNMERVDKETSAPTGFYCVPVWDYEMEEWEAHDLLDAARHPRTRAMVPPAINTPEEWPEFEVHADYLRSDNRVADVRELEAEPGSFGEEWLNMYLSDVLHMPCMYERIMQPNPGHHTRLNSTVLLYNAGLTPRDVEDLYMEIGWRDSDRATTRHQLEQIWRRGYADMSCETLQGLGLCTRTDDPESCPTYGWEGGTSEWGGE